MASLLTRWAAADSLPVSISYVGHAERSVAERLAWELHSEGYRVNWEEPRSPWQCSREPREPRGGAQAWVRVQADESRPGGVRTLACYQSPDGALYETGSLGSASDAQTLSLATVEALHGVRAKVAARAPTPRESAPELVESRPRAAHARRGSAFIGPALASDVDGVGPFFATSAGAELGLTRTLSLAVQGFWSVAPVTLRGPDRTLFARAAWLRAGPRLSAVFGPFVLGASALVGPGLVWVRADATPPRVGRSASTAVVIVSLGASLEYPSSGLIYAHAGTTASGTLPRVRFQLSEQSSREFGESLFDGCLGMGLRWE